MCHAKIICRGLYLSQSLWKDRKYEYLNLDILIRIYYLNDNGRWVGVEVHQRVTRQSIIMIMNGMRFRNVAYLWCRSRHSPSGLTSPGSNNHCSLVHLPHSQIHCHAPPFLPAPASASSSSLFFLNLGTCKF